VNTGVDYEIAIDGRFKRSINLRASTADRGDQVEHGSGADEKSFIGR